MHPVADARRKKRTHPRSNLMACSVDLNLTFALMKEKNFLFHLMKVHRNFPARRNFLGAHTKMGRARIFRINLNSPAPGLGHIIHLDPLALPPFPQKRHPLSPSFTDCLHAHQSSFYQEYAQRTHLGHPVRLEPEGNNKLLFGGFTLKRFEKRTVIVTGAGGGIGRATCLRLAIEGALAICMDIAETREETARLAIEQGASAGGRGVAVHLDITDPEGVTREIAGVIKTHGPIDALINCIGGGQPLPSLEIDEAAFEAMFEYNVKSTYRACWALLPHMRERKSGKIVNFSSVAGRSASVLQGAHYSSSKAAVIGLTRHLAREFGPSGINVNAVAPGVILTPRIRAQLSPAQEAGTIAATPLGRIGTAEDVASVVAFLASDDARHVTGVTIDVNGGYFLA
jgi:3-oxoacyl-[acyl-carrier protein] reductase